MKPNMKHFYYLLVALILAGCSSERDFVTMKYLPVQFEKGGKWSLINENGEVVAGAVFDASTRDAPMRFSEELDAYEEERQVINPPIVNSDIYFSRGWGKSLWVRHGNEGKWSLYSVDNLEEPLTNVKYLYVTDMIDGRALAARSVLHPIDILDEDGHVVASLPDDVVFAYHPCRSFFCFERKDGTWGCTNRDGKIIKDGLEGLPFGGDAVFGDDVVVAREGSEFVIFDDEGKKIGSFEADEIRCCFIASNRIAAWKDDNVHLYDYSGNDVATLKHIWGIDVFGSSYNDPASGEFLYFYDSSDYAVCGRGLINTEGEKVISKKITTAIGGDLFIAEHSYKNKYGIINADGEVVIDFDYIYDGIKGRLGDNFVVKEKEDGLWYVLDGEGKRQLGEGFKNCDYYVLCVLGLPDFSGIASQVAQLAKDYIEHEWVELLADRLGVSCNFDFKDIDNKDKRREGDIIERIGVRGGSPLYLLGVYITYDFGEQTLVETYRPDPFFYPNDYQYRWNSWAELQSLRVEMCSGNDLSYDEAAKTMKEELTKLGFRQKEDGRMYINVNGSERRISFERGKGEGRSENLVFVID